ncbi:hypothetical protein MIR68_004904 [Amoeboaphelidium protococcarum]|nr:hypothetical protein MIR68_004904 [Amoeboaphelidium protococcarum]KAI3653306.1 hypothetical protein MP228_001253 [Amoeboaphelidium protococcarum]
MSCLRELQATDLFGISKINLDPLTETYNLSYYLTYLLRWPTYNYKTCSPSSSVMSQNSPGQPAVITGYVLGKAEGTGANWHGHVTALTTLNSHRKTGVAKTLMNHLECVSQEFYDGFFVDLFVRVSNKVAVQMYTSMGYVVYRRVLQYYSGCIDPNGSSASGDEDAFDMRKSLRRDPQRLSMIPLKHPVTADEV